VQLNCPHSDQRALGSQGPSLGYASRCLRFTSHAFGGATRLLYPSCFSGRSTRRSFLEHGGKGGICRTPAIARGRLGPHGDVFADYLFFFGDTATVSTVLDRIGPYPRTFVLDFTEVPLIDTTAAKAMEAFVHKLRRAGTDVFIAGARPNVRRTLFSSGLHEPEVLYTANVKDARERVRIKRQPVPETLAKGMLLH
jgi:anti-anti-sigma regulatory factor